MSFSFTWHVNEFGNNSYRLACDGQRMKSLGL